MSLPCSAFTTYRSHMFGVKSTTLPSEFKLEKNKLGNYIHTVVIFDDICHFYQCILTFMKLVTIISLVWLTVGASNRSCSLACFLFLLKTEELYNINTANATGESLRRTLRKMFLKQDLQKSSGILSNLSSLRWR